MNLRFRAVIAAVCLLLAVQLAAAPFELPSKKERWTQLKVSGFLIYSSASDNVTMRIAGDLLRMRATMAQVSGFKVAAPIETKVFIFATQDKFIRFAEAALDRKANVAGIFLPSEDANFIAISAEADDHGGVVYHELTHFFVENTFRDVPLWLDEGLAEFYSSFESRAKSIRLGRVIPDHVHLLRDRKLMPLEELFAIEHKSKDYNEGIRQGIYYAQSWAMVHYALIGNQERAPQLNEFVRLIAAGKPQDEAFRTAFKTDYASFQKEVQQYVRRQVFSGYEVDQLESAFDEKERPTVTTRAEVMYQLADFMAHSARGNFDVPLMLVRAAIEEDPKLADAHSTLGFIHERQNEHDKAAAAYATAMQLGSAHYLTYLRAGEQKLRQITAQSFELGTRDSEALKIRELFQRATKLNGAIARGFAGLGATYALTMEEPKPGIEALRRSLAMKPDQPFARQALEILEERVQEKPTMVTRQAAADSGPPSRGTRRGPKSVRSSELAQINKAQDLARAGQLDQAVALLEKTAAESSDEDIDQTVEVMLRLIKEQKERKAEIALYDSLVAKTNSGAYREALKIADQLISTAKNAELVKAVKEIRVELLKVVK